MSANLISISHKIALKPNNKAITHFIKAFGCARFAYNWGLAKWKDNYSKDIKTTHISLNNEFNKIKKELYPFVYEVSKYATQSSFRNLDRAFSKFFADLKQGKISYPKFKCKKDNAGSYYIGGDQVVIKNSKYLKIPKLGLVKMAESLRFNGKINSVTISKKANKFYASFSMQISKDEYNRTHKLKAINNKIVGIDLGISSFASLSNGLQIKAPKPLAKFASLLLRRSRRLSKKLHPRTKGDTTKKSKNYIKQACKLSKLHTKISNIRNDFLHKFSSHLVKNYQNIAIENLSISSMLKEHKIAKCMSDISLYEFKRHLEYKSRYNDVNLFIADKFYPSSKICSKCGNIKDKLKLSDRIYKCEACGNIIDRDINASINLAKLVGQVLPQFTPMDLTALLDDLKINNLTTSKVEIGIQQKFYNL